MPAILSRKYLVEKDRIEWAPIPSCNKWGVQNQVPLTDGYKAEEPAL